MENKNLTFSKLLTTSSILCELMKKVEKLTKVNQLVSSQLDPELSKHCRVLGYENGVLTLGTDSPAWGHTLRFAESELLSRLRAHPEWCGLKAVRSRVLPARTSNTASHPTTNTALETLPPLTQQDADLLQLTAHHVPSESLRKALLKLARRALIKE